MKYFFNFIRNVFTDKGSDEMTIMDAVCNIILFSLSALLMGVLFYFFNILFGKHIHGNGRMNIIILLFYCGVFCGIFISIVGYSTFKKKK